MKSGARSEVLSGPADPSRTPVSSSSRSIEEDSTGGRNERSSEDCQVGSKRRLYPGALSSGHQIFEVGEVHVQTPEPTLVSRDLNYQG